MRKRHRPQWDDSIPAPAAGIEWDDPRFKRLTVAFLALFVIMAGIAGLVGLYFVATAVLICGLALYALFAWSQIRNLWRWLRGRMH